MGRLWIQVQIQQNALSLDLDREEALLTGEVTDIVFAYPARDIGA